MKKALAMALGAVLVAGSAAPASAASQIDFSGFYRATFNADGNLSFRGNDKLSDDHFYSRLRVNVNFQATDEVSVHWRIHAPHGDRWGNDRTRGNVESVYFYGQVVQDWGTIRVGRVAGGVDEFGLATLGWVPTVDPNASNISAFDAGDEQDAIQYFNTWDNGFGLRASYQKYSANWSNNPYDRALGDNRSSDHDWDRFQVEGFYMWEGGGASLNVMYDRDATSDPERPAYIGLPADVYTLDKTTAWYINPAIMHSWGAFSVHAEGMFGFGENHGVRVDANNKTKSTDIDSEGQGFYLDFDYNYGPGRVNLAGWWVSGNDLGDTENKALVNMGGNFYPLAVAYANNYGYGSRSEGDGAVSYANNIVAEFNSDVVRATGTAIPGLGVNDDAMTFVNANVLLGANVLGGSRFAMDNGEANHWAIMLSGQHAFTDEVSLHYALAYLALNNPNYKVLSGFSYDGGTASFHGAKYHTQDKDLGFEIDLGVHVQLLDNLTFTTTFGYMFAGDAYKTMDGVVVNENGGDYTAKAKWKDGDDAYTWTNALIFSF